MKKIPVRDTIAYGYSFTFGHLGTIIGLIWLPMVIVAVAGYFVMSGFYNSVPDAVSAGNPVVVGQSYLVVMVWWFASLLLYSMMYVAVMRQALGLREGPAVVHFHLGIAEWRVFGVILGLFAIALVFLMGDGALLALFKGLGAKVPAVMALGALVYLAGLLAIVYAMVRLSFLAIPATVAEDTIALGRGWELSRGNFWRIFAVGVATLLPLLLVMGVAEVAIMGRDFFIPKVLGPQVDAAQRMQAMAAQMRAASGQLPLLSGLAFLLAPFLTGLTMAPAAFAYRALTAPEAPSFGHREHG